MNINNPFESGHIKNYILLYVSVVVIMILFFIASTLFHENEVVEKKIFATEGNLSQTINVEKDKIIKEEKPKFRLLDKAY